MALTHDQAIEVAVFVLHHSGEDRRITSGEITNRAIEPALRAHWLQKGIELPWDAAEDRQGFALALTHRLKHHVSQTPASERVVEGSEQGWALGPGAKRRPKAAGPPPDASPE